MAEEKKPNEGEGNNPPAPPAEEKKETPPAKTPAEIEEEKKKQEEGQNKPPQGEDDDDDDDDDKGKPPEGTVSMKKFLKRERKIQALQDEIESYKNPTQKNLEEVAKKFNLNNEFVREFSQAIGKVTEENVDKKYSPLLTKDQQAEIDKKFSEEFGKLSTAHPALKEKERQIKVAAFTKEFRNKPLDEVAKEFYPEAFDKSSSESNARPGSDKGTETVDFANMSPDTRKKVLSTPELREKYYSWADKNGL